MKRKLALSIVTLAGVLSLLVPATSSADHRGPLCVHQKMGKVNVIVGYCP
jgi:hypothetical protein